MGQKSKDLIKKLERKIARLQRKQALSEALLLLLAARAIESHKDLQSAPSDQAPPSPNQGKEASDRRREAREIVDEIAQKMQLHATNGVKHPV
ncbi:hypothetical protein MMA231_04125 (plasmid) [Asticcacaulis sp. MM231]|uniref:hypothetical protein n=1 Tax=Asticcacaulis sp. MM231 TaxID=3157666 RepID=UPI0032D58A3F